MSKKSFVTHPNVFRFFRYLPDFCIDILVTLPGDTFSGELFVGRNFRHPTKKLSHSPDEKFRPKKIKVSFIKVQVNLTKKQVIYTNYDYFVGRNFVGRKFRRAKLFVG